MQNFGHLIQAFGYGLHFLKYILPKNNSDDSAYPVKTDLRIYPEFLWAFLTSSS